MRCVEEEQPMQAIPGALCVRPRWSELSEPNARVLCSAVPAWLAVSSSQGVAQLIFFAF